MFCSTDPIGSLWDDTWLFSVLFSPLLDGWMVRVSQECEACELAAVRASEDVVKMSSHQLSAPANCLPGHWHTNLICYLGRLQNLSSILSLSLIKIKCLYYSSVRFCAVKYNNTQ